MKPVLLNIIMWFNSHSNDQNGVFNLHNDRYNKLLSTMIDAVYQSPNGWNSVLNFTMIAKGIDMVCQSPKWVIWWNNRNTDWYVHITSLSTMVDMIYPSPEWSIQCVERDSDRYGISIIHL